MNNTLPILTDEEKRMIGESLSHLFSHYVMQSTRSRTFSKKSINYRDQKKREERIELIRNEWSEKADKVFTLMMKIDNFKSQISNQ
ncbi:MAG: hypothetical protein ACJ749_01015 [Flavisolibacter sp.]|jgi:hypothetical protein